MVLGIDLGTSNTVVSTISRDGAAVIIPDIANRELLSTPTKVLIDVNRAFAGSFAESLFELYPQKKLLTFFKRFFGSGMPVYTDEQDNAWFSEGLAALILKKVMFDADAFLPEGYQRCVITVPAHYNDVQRKSVYEAARLANLELTAILDEPVAAALHYGAGQLEHNSEAITLVYDFGGGTFDLTLITQNREQLHVIAKDGIDKLGGKEFDEIMASYIRKAYQEVYSQPFPQDPLSLNRLQQQAEQMKIDLNKSGEPLLAQWMLVGRKAFECRVPAASFREQALNYIKQTGQAVNRCIRALGMQLSDIDNIILIGGTSNSQLVYQYWQSLTAGTKTKIIYHQPFSSVAKGAALYAQSLEGGKHGLVSPVSLTSVSTYNIGLLSPGASQPDLMIHRNTPLPVSAMRRFQLNRRAAVAFALDVCQYWETNELHILGTIQLDAAGILHDMVLEIQLENKANGTIGLKLRNADNGKDLKFSFDRRKSDYEYNFQKQKQLVDDTFLNQIF